ncbi:MULTISPECIES: NAD kinase [unclassified Pseudoclavibacter]|jgi:NAD+ kinase|uniref:NAD kinase n=1 Tax=unclassified Pseudoclavibacter TaxID=2615177 RepID=UPI000CE85A18|nr:MULTISPECIES: NAD kinase [unclassified Pseudoclavibacter]MBS3178434.1 NAD kinase [Pseudoclavibacter sp. Marseille-Q4354]NYF14134.1 NAD+ kinase [Pseudoclavibacter sp. JAI123]PPG28286.1 NAD kinase [Pseudoclavibacter sp. RFBB5]
MTEFPKRRILVVSHVAREDAIEAAMTVLQLLDDAGVTPVLEPATYRELVRLDRNRVPRTTISLGEELAAHEVEIAIVLGGDGTILRAAEIVREAGVPILGVNLGHVGFLAESERDSLADAVGRALDRDYQVEERMTLDVRVTLGGETVYETWALNEATIEKASRERMLELVLEVDGQPLLSFGADGAIFSTPTGSTAYSFSAGGPIVWPTVEALLLVPISAHALFARPIVVGPSSTLAVEIVPRTGTPGVLWCDGRRTYDLTAGSRVTATRGGAPIRLARLHSAPFSKRLVEKFQLPTSGWRGPARA